jgi:YegS/Rv2252/BmrU family lipid kinase
MTNALPHVLLINPIAGGGHGRAIGEEVEKALSVMGCEVEYLVGGPGEEFVTQFPATQVTRMVVVGGDGTLRGAADGLAGKNVEIILVPAGRGNDFARTLGLPVGRVDAGEIWRIAMTAGESGADRITSDVGEVNGIPFLNGAGFGFEGKVVERMAGGGRSYARAALRAMAGWRPFRAEIQDGDTTINGEFVNLSVMNGRMAGGGFQIAPQAKIDDGMLDMVAVGGLHPWEKLLYLYLVRNGAHLRMKGVTTRGVQSITLAADRDIPWHLDGEAQPHVREFRIKLRPEKLIFRLPRQ